ncbi:SgcJ/EcaC family oxidoreductase [Sphingomicrobium sp. XHP0235]|uniref:YybH family protein n=1 Tax=Sphingomicrobium aquimarinum TaxID=3133971 RepID=UPI0031FF0CB1
MLTVRAGAVPAIAILLFATACESAPPSDAPPSVDEQTAPQSVEDIRAQIEAVMADSAAGWNEGDMERFLAIYSDAPETSFVGSSGLVRGRSAMEARYREAYDWSDPDPAERGTLSFETEDVRALGPEHALFIARYVLTYPDATKEPATGFTSLVFAREEGGWRIVADHSS